MSPPDPFISYSIFGFLGGLIVANYTMLLSIGSYISTKDKLLIFIGSPLIGVLFGLALRSFEVFVLGK